MERSQNINSRAEKRFKQQRANISVRLIAIFHIVGIVGLFLLYLKPFFLTLVPYHLLLMAIILLVNHDPKDGKFLLFFILVFGFGFGLECLGVNTHLVFGNYTYGDVLGPQIAGVPLVIGLNWFMLIYAIGVSLQRSKIDNIWLRILLGALTLVFLDFLIEPVAIRFNYWDWYAHRAPPRNFVWWFVISAALLFVFEKFRFAKQSIVGPSFLVAQFIFFAALQ